MPLLGVASRKFTRSAAGHNTSVYCPEGACIAANCNGIRRWIAQVGRRAQSKMWEFEMPIWERGMSGGYSSKKRDGW